MQKKQYLSMSSLLIRYQPSYTVEPNPEIPREYLAVDKAGSGSFAEVYFCVPKSFIQSTKNSGPNRAELSNLTGFLQAVKVSKPQNHGSIADEILVLKRIQEAQQQVEGNSHFFKLLAWDTDNPIPRWVATSTLPLCCDLKSLHHYEQAFPKVIVWFLFVQLYEALDFLYKVCDPPIEHNDLHEGNVIIGYSDADQTSLPQVKIIDFGLAKPDMSAQCPLSEVDATGVVAIVYRLIQGTYPVDKFADMEEAPVLDPFADHETIAFYEFHMDLWRQGEMSEGTILLPQLWQYYSAYAKSQIATASPSSMGHVKDIIKHVAQARYSNLEHRIEELLNDDTIS